MAISGDIVTKSEFDHNKALAEAIATALGEMLTVRTQDLPHRFRAPASFAAHMEDWGTNSTYHSVPIHGASPANGMTIQMTTRPTQKIFEMVFQDFAGMRLFTLEIEYGDAVPKKREVLLPSWSPIHKTPDHRNTSRKETTKASSFLSECPGLNWHKISLKRGAELIPHTLNLNRSKCWEFRAAAKPIGFVKLSKSE